MEILSLSSAKYLYMNFMIDIAVVKTYCIRGLCVLLIHTVIEAS